MAEAGVFKTIRLIAVKDIFNMYAVTTSGNWQPHLLPVWLWPLCGSPGCGPIPVPTHGVISPSVIELFNVWREFPE